MRDFGLLTGVVVAGITGMVLAERGLNCLSGNPSIDYVAFGGVYLLPFLGSLSILIAGIALAIGSGIAFIKLDGIATIRMLGRSILAGINALLLTALFAIERQLGLGRSHNVGV